MRYTNTIIEIIQSGDFKTALENINSKYPNLKQELTIKDTILEMYNAQGKSGFIRAFSEHPREKCRIDLSIINKHDLKNPFLVEFKFQFPKDYEKYDLHTTINCNFGKRKVGEHYVDLFILIFAQWNIEEKREFDGSWGIDSNLSKYQYKPEEEKYKSWKDDIRDKFNNYPESCECKEKLNPVKVNLRECTVVIDKPYKVEYSFFFYERENK